MDFTDLQYAIPLWIVCATMGFATVLLCSDKKGLAALSINVGIIVAGFLDTHVGGTQYPWPGMIIFGYGTMLLSFMVWGAVALRRRFARI